MPPAYVGRQACADCHVAQVAAWSGSHHDLALQVADRTTVRANFEGASLTHFGIESKFFRRNDKFFVRTDGPDGELTDYQVTHTIGVDPLQQYVVAFPGGRYQVLGMAWDTRAVEEGGQRWFHLYPDEAVRHEDFLHWTGLAQNWNHVCAECHSTNLRKGYLVEDDRFETTFSEMDVSCEACHGPASNHVAWAHSSRENADSPAAGDLGLLVRFNEREQAGWAMDPQTGKVTRHEAPAWRPEVETCARCHARRSMISEDYVHGRPILDTHRVAILDESLYHADGQILGEVYVYGSFLQSKMFRQGVTCSDCHDAHSTALTNDGNKVCTGCHLPERFDTRAHHFHETGTESASCVECHMPATTYMVVDPRRDHSLRVPRPDLSVALGTPNACNLCHAEKSPQWAADAVEEWYGVDRRREGHWGGAIHAGRNSAVDARERLTAVVEDQSVPGIARATAVSLLSRFATPRTIPLLAAMLRDADPLVRLAALEAIEVLPPGERLGMAYPLLGDGLRAVRLQAAKTLAAVPASLMTVEQREDFDAALREYRKSRLVDADRPEAYLDLGTVDAQRGDLAEAERAFRLVMQTSPHLAAAYVNLADVYRAQGRDEEGERLLRRALEFGPNDSDVRHALGLLLVRGDRLDEAIDELRRAAEMNPDQPRYAYVLAVALYSTQRVAAAVETLRAANERHPADPVIATFLRQLEADSRKRTP